MAKHWTRAQRDLFDERAPGMKLGTAEQGEEDGADSIAPDGGDGNLEKSAGDGQ